MFENDDLDVDSIDTASDDGQASQAPTPFEIPDDAFVSVKVDGEDKLLPWKDARSGVMFQSTFTRKTQELANQRRAFEDQSRDFQSRQQEYDTRLGQLQNVLRNPQALAALYMHMSSQQQQPQEPQPLTTDYLPRIEQTVEQRLEQALGKMREQFSQERQAERYEQDMDTFMAGVMSKHPVLKAVEGIEDTIYSRVAVLKPKSIDEAKELARTMVEGMSQAAMKAMTEQAKADALAKARAGQGIEPRGGQPLFNRPPTVNKLEDLDNAFIQYLQQQGRAAE
jgi:hypothetical protein